MAVTLTWNGDTTGLTQVPADLVGEGFYKVSDRHFTLEELEGFTLKIAQINTGGELDFTSLLTATTIMVDETTSLSTIVNKSDNAVLVYTLTNDVTYQGFSIEKGTYFITNKHEYPETGIYVSTLILPNAIEETLTRKITRLYPSGAVAYSNGNKRWRKMRIGESKEESCIGTWLLNNIIDVSCLEDGSTLALSAKFIATNAIGKVELKPVVRLDLYGDSGCLGYWLGPSTIYTDLYDPINRIWKAPGARCLVVERELSTDAKNWLNANGVKLYPATDAGLYDADDNLIVSWDTLVNTYKMNCTKDYTYSTYETSTTSPYYILTNNSELAGGVKMIIGDVPYIGSNAFLGCTSLTTYIIGDTVVKICSGAFPNESSLTRIRIGKSVITIDNEKEFCYNNSLVDIDVDIDNDYYKSIDGNLYTIDGKTLIQYALGKSEISFTMPDSVTSIGDYAFFMNTSLTDIMLGNSVVNIGESAFYRCTELTNISIPDSVTSIGVAAFAACYSLEEIVFNGTVLQWNAITLGANWNSSAPATHVQCSDGTVPI